MSRTYKSPVQFVPATTILIFPPIQNTKTMIDTSTIANCIEIPELLSVQLTAFLDKSPTWDIDKAFSTAIAAFLEAQKEAQNV